LEKIIKTIQILHSNGFPHRTSETKVNDYTFSIAHGDDPKTQGIKYLTFSVKGIPKDMNKLKADLKRASIGIGQTIGKERERIEIKHEIHVDDINDDELRKMLEIHKTYSGIAGLGSQMLDLILGHLTQTRP